MVAIPPSNPSLSVLYCLLVFLQAGVAALKKVIQQLKEYNPLFVDFTWGAGGSTSTLTFDLCRDAKETFGLNPNMHLTCTNMDRAHIDTALANCHKHGLRNILALRGDPPAGQERWTAADSQLTCAEDLVHYIRSAYDDYFSISVAGYPEGHPAAMVEVAVEDKDSLTASELLRSSLDSKTVPNPQGEGDLEVQIINVCKDEAFAREMDYLKKKIAAGARFIITQMFFDVEVYGTFVKACHDHGIDVPIVPGIMCIANYGGFKRMIKFCKTRVPEAVMNKMEELKDDAEKIKEFGIEFGITMCRRLQELGAPGFHFYTLNTTGVTTSILEGLGYHKVALA